MHIWVMPCWELRKNMATSEKNGGDQLQHIHNFIPIPFLLLLGARILHCVLLQFCIIVIASSPALGKRKWYWPPRNLSTQILIRLRSLAQQNEWNVASHKRPMQRPASNCNPSILRLCGKAACSGPVAKATGGRRHVHWLSRGLRGMRSAVLYGLVNHSNIRLVAKWADKWLKEQTLSSAK